MWDKFSAYSRKFDLTFTLHMAQYVISFSSIRCVHIDTKNNVCFIGFSEVSCFC